ncbi:MAG TPA: hypothetical protein VHE55_14790 [Fimbriimonadaceae bacterium]|nr:hypothetical protein [Fimbriimonadaceae bacterium]
MATTLYTTFPDVPSSERAAGALLDFGVRPEDISLVRNQQPPERPGEPYVAGRSKAESELYDNLAAADNEVDPERIAKVGITTTTPDDAGEGAIKGTEVGLGVGAIAALASIFVPGLGLVTGGGALAIALAGFAATAGAGAIAGAVTGYLKDQGMEWEAAKHYGMIVEQGGAILSVAVPSGPVSESEARSILAKYGATNVKNYTSPGLGYIS